LVDALVDGVAVIINCILFASDAFRDNCLRFVGDEAVNCLVRISNEVESAWLQLLQAGNAVSKGTTFSLRR
jgi:hypothetical protein